MSGLSPAAILHNSASTEVGTATDPLRTDPTGTTAQPVTDGGGSITVDGTVAVSGTVPVSGPLTDTQLRATPVPVSDGGGSLTVDGVVNVGNFPGIQSVDDGGGSLTVDGPLTDAQLRASAVPVSAASLPLPAGAATEATLALIKAKTDNLDVALSTRAVTGLTDTQLRATAVPVSGPLTDAQLRASAVPVSAASLPLPTGAATAALQTQPGVDIGDVTVNNGAGASAVNIQDGGNSITVDGPLTDTQLRATPVPVSGTVTANAGTGPWPVTDNGGSLTVDSPQLPAALVGGRLDENVGAWLGSTAPTVGQKTMANSVPVAISSDQSAIKVEGRAADGAALVGDPVLVGGSDGTNAQSLSVDSSGRLILAPAGAGATKGFAAGEAVLAATTIVPIRSTTYTEQAANATRSVASASANDSSAGTGARTIRITYYDVAMAGPFTTDVTMNGTTAVATSASDICFIEKIEVLTVGSTGSNVGIITLYVNNAGGGGTIWTIAATANQTKGAHHYCPAGVTCYITGLLVGIKGADTTSGFIRAKDPTVAAAAETQISDVIRAPSSGQNFRPYGTAIAVPGPSRITVFAAPDSTSSRTYYGSFDYYEE